MASIGKLCAVIGASGKLGRALTDEALKHNLRVRAIVRPTSKYEDSRPDVEVIKVELNDIDKLTEVFNGTDVIFVAIRGRSGLTCCNDMTRYIRNMVDAMVDNDYELKANVERIIITSCIATTREGKSRMSTYSKFMSFFNRGHIADLAAMEHASMMTGHDANALEKMSLTDFTIVRPTTLSDRSPSHDKVVGFQSESNRKIKKSIPKHNVASYMIEEIYLGGGYSRDSVMIGLEAV